MKKLYLLLLAGLFSLALFAQSDPRIAHAKTPLEEIPVVLMPHLDNAALLAAELDRRAPGVAPKFAEPIGVDISTATAGHWEPVGHGKSIWRLRIRSAGAKSLNLGFSKYVMPAGGSLIIYSPDYQNVQGPFTPSDNEEHEQLWTPIIPGEELVVEVQVPTHSQSALQLQLSYVNHDFVGFMDIASGSCNLDVICGAADGWAIVDKYRDIIQSVAVISTGGSTFCTGFLVNNARQDCTPYFMTANHCGITAGEAPSLVTYWNFINTTCRQPNSQASGNNGNGVLNDFNTGSVLRATNSNSDFTLVELDDPVSPTANAFFAGWSAEDFAPTDTVICIHHPNTEEKRISFDFDPTFIADYNSTTPNPNGTHITIADWDIGTTEGGSSGSPLFNRQKRVVGQLHGGLAFCGNDLNDSFGWFHISWEGGGQPGNSLKPWLDPDNSGIITLDGRSALQCSFFVEAIPASISLCAPADAVYTINVSPNFTADVMLSIANLPAGLTATFADNPVAPGGTTTLTISNTGVLAEGNYSFTLVGTDGTASNSSELVLGIATQTPAPPTPIFPVDGAVGIGLAPDFTWTAGFASSYIIEIATDAAFQNIIESASGLTTPSFSPMTSLAQITTYYWRVRGENSCGVGDWAADPFSFTTAAIVCGPVVSTNVPLVISPNGTPTVTSTITVAGSGFVDDINVTNLNITHSWVSDLNVMLTSPSGTSITLFSNVNNDACGNNNVQVSFDDQAASTYADLDGMCNPTPPALFGNFQPFEPLSTFNGEPIGGIWTLTIFDDFSDDGGSLVSWGLDLCSTIPNDFSVLPTATSFSTCLDDELHFNLTLGTAFDDTTGVTLVAENLPAGVTASFDPNPAAPGTTVSVTLTGAVGVGSYDFDVIATDGLGNTGSVSLQWNVLGNPAAPTPIAPAPNATGVSLTPQFSWSATGTDYFLTVATDPGMNTIVASYQTQQTSQQVSGLAPCTTYYWQVTSATSCGFSTPVVYSFTTLDVLIFNASPSVLASCGTNNTTISLAIGNCFEPNGVTLSAMGLPPGATIDFIQNPAPPGDNTSIGLNLVNVAPGSYNITVTGMDGIHNVTETFTLNITAPAAAPVFVAPANAATNVNVLTAFDWNAVAGATSYNFQLATDANFTNIVTDQTVTQTAYTLTSPLNVNTTYYWRVTAFNSCGGTTPAPFSFTTWLMNSTTELNGLSIKVLPNPTAGLVSVQFSQPIFEAVDASVYAVNGILVKNQQVQNGSCTASFDLLDLPSGVYLLRLKSGSAVLTEKLILEK